jgi:hypothetical protein
VHCLLQNNKIQFTCIYAPFLVKSSSQNFLNFLSFLFKTAELFMIIVPTISIVDAERQVTSNAVPVSFYHVTTAGCDADHATVLTYSPPFVVKSLRYVQYIPYHIRSLWRVSHSVFHIVRFWIMPNLYNEQSTKIYFPSLEIMQNKPMSQTVFYTKKLFKHAINGSYTIKHKHQLQYCINLVKMKLVMHQLYFQNINSPSIYYTPCNKIQPKQFNEIQLPKNKTKFHCIKISPTCQCNDIKTFYKK